MKTLANSMILVLLSATLVSSGLAAPRGQAECAVPADAEYVAFDSGGFAVRKVPDLSADVDFTIKEPDGQNFPFSGPYLSALLGVERHSDHWVVRIQVDGNDEFVNVPLRRLWAVRFIASEHDFSTTAQSDDFGLPKASPGVLACATAERREQAKKLFALAFDRLAKNDLVAARQMFYSGLLLDPHDPDALFYYAEAQRMSGDLGSDGHDYRRVRMLYERAVEFGLGADAKWRAADQIKKLQALEAGK